MRDGRACSSEATEVDQALAGFTGIRMEVEQIGGQLAAANESLQSYAGRL